MCEVSRYLSCGSGRGECPGETDDDGVFVGDAVCDINFIGGEVMVEFDGGECVSFLHSEDLGEA